VSDPGELYREGVEAFRRGESERSSELNEQSLALAREQDDGGAIVNALMGLARVALRDGDLERVHALAREGRELALSRGLEDSLVLPLHLEAEAARMGGDFAGARGLYEESIALNRRLGDERMVAVEQTNLAWVGINTGDLDAAEALIRESLAATDEEDVYLRAFGSIGLARCDAERGETAAARERLADAERLLVEAKLVLDPADRPEYERTVELAQARP
jgi:ATP/maltotriose-dependent transcriptional regulator MalT